MATCSVQTLLDDSACFARLAGPGQWEQAKLALLCQILQALDPMATCDVQSLLTAGKCFYPAVSEGMGQTIELQLLCEISDAIGGGGIATDYNLLYDDVASLPAAPADQTKVWFASFRDGSAGVIWDPVALAWI